jgi:UDP-glucuronate 4-epimerase
MLVSDEGDMATLITGGCGFVGINLAEELSAQRERVVLYDQHGLPEPARQVLEKTDIPPTLVSGDIRDSTKLAEVLREFTIDRVIHAAVITAGAAREANEPDEIVDVNVKGTISVLHAARAAACRRVMYVSSGSAYGQTLNEAGPLYEDLSPSRPETLYGVTKFASEQIARRLGALWKMAVVCVRLGTVFGPWEFDTKVRDTLSTPLQLAQLAKRGETAVLPCQEVRRDWIYSRDVASGLAATLMAAHPRHDLYHLSSGVGWQGTMLKWCAILSKAYPEFKWRISTSREKPNVSYQAERDRAPMDIARIVDDIGYKPRFGPDEALDDYMSWLLKNPDF